MRTIPFEQIASAVEKLCIESCLNLPQDVLTALEKAVKKESSNSAKKILNQLIENAKTAKDKQIPICQDTGLAVVFLQLGSDVATEPKNETLVDAVNAGVQ